MTTSDLEYAYRLGVAGVPVPVPHTHAETDIVNLQSDLASKGAAAHTHNESDIAGLVNALLNKADTGHSHSEAEIGNLSTDLAAKAAAVHTHAQSGITNLTSDLTTLTNSVNGKAPTAHGHAESEITSLATDLTNLNNGLTGKAAFVHTHAESDIIGLIAALANFAPKIQAGTAVQMANVDPTTQPANALFIVNNDPTWSIAIYAAMGSPQVWTMIAAVPITVHEIESTAITGAYTASASPTTVNVGAGLSFAAPGYDFRIECEIPSIGVGMANVRGMCSLYDEASVLKDVCLVSYPGTTDNSKGVQGRILTEPISAVAGASKTFQLVSVRSGENTTTNSVSSALVTGVTIPIKMRAIPV